MGKMETMLVKQRHSVNERQVIALQTFLKQILSLNFSVKDTYLSLTPTPLFPSLFLKDLETRQLSVETGQ